MGSEGGMVGVAAAGRGAEDDGNACGTEAGNRGADGVINLAECLPEQMVVGGVVFRWQSGGQRLPVVRGAAANGEAAVGQPAVFFGKRLCGRGVEGGEGGGGAVAEGADEAGAVQVDHGSSGAMCAGGGVQQVALCFVLDAQPAAVVVVVAVLLLADVRIGVGIVQQHKSGEEGADARVWRQKAVVVPSGSIVGLPRQRRAEWGSLYPAPLPVLIMADDVAVAFAGGTGAVLQFDDGRARAQGGERQRRGAGGKQQAEEGGGGTGHGGAVIQPATAQAAAVRRTPSSQKPKFRNSLKRGRRRMKTRPSSEPTSQRVLRLHQMAKAMLHFGA